MHGGLGLKELGGENVAAVQAGCANLVRHVRNMQKFGLPVVVAINRFTADTPAELAEVAAACHATGVQAVPCNHWAEGGAGALALADAVMAVARAEIGLPPALPGRHAAGGKKIRTVAAQIYGAADVVSNPRP